MTPALELNVYRHSVKATGHDSERRTEHLHDVMQGDNVECTKWGRREHRGGPNRGGWAGDGRVTAGRRAGDGRRATIDTAARTSGPIWAVGISTGVPSLPSAWRYVASGLGCSRPCSWASRMVSVTMASIGADAATCSCENVLTIRTIRPGVHARAPPSSPMA